MWWLTLWRLPRPADARDVAEGVVVDEPERALVARRASRPWTFAARPGPTHQRLVAEFLQARHTVTRGVIGTPWNFATNTGEIEIAHAHGAVVPVLDDVCLDGGHAWPLMIKVTIGGVIAILQLDWGCACRRDPCETRTKDTAPATASVAPKT